MGNERLRESFVLEFINLINGTTWRDMEQASVIVRQEEMYAHSIWNYGSILKHKTDFPNILYN